MKHRPEQILDAALHLFDVEGVGVSTSKVARAAGVGNGTLFNYFPSKQELIDALYVRLKTQLADAIGEIDDQLSLRDQAKAVWDRWLAWGRANPEARRVSRLLHESGLAGPAAAAVVDAVLVGPMAVLDRLGASGELVDLPLDYIGSVMQAHLELAVDVAIDAGPDGTHLAAFHDRAFESMWSAISRPAMSRPAIPQETLQ